MQYVAYLIHSYTTYIEYKIVDDYNMVVTLQYETKITNKISYAVSLHKNIRIVHNYRITVNTISIYTYIFT